MAGEQSFRVDLHGVVDLLANHLYSGPQVFLRELLQNAVDAIAARRANDGSATDEVTGEVTVRASLAEDGRPRLTVVDNGIGLSPDDVERFLGVIGRSSKRDELGLSRLDYIGQFGVGLLSCFAVADRIEVVSRSIDRSVPAVRWVGSSDGTWSTSTIDGAERSPGSEVTILARPGEERWFDPDLVIRYLRHYGELLRDRIFFAPEGATAAAELVNRVDVPLRRPLDQLDSYERGQLLAFGADMLGFEPLDVLPLAAPSGQARGAAFVLPAAPPPSAARSDRVYVKGMLVSDATDRLLPPWAFFVRCIIEADAVNPTASREDLHNDEVLAMVRDELGASLRNTLAELAARQPDRLQAIIDVHHLSLKALAIADREFLALVADWLPVETTDGMVAFGDFRRRRPTAYLTRTVDEFRQVAPIAAAQDIGVVCGGYTHDAELVARAAEVFDDFSVTPVELADLFGGFGDLDPDEEEATRALVEAAGEAVKPFDAEVMVRRFEPVGTPALFSLGEIGRKLRSMRRTSQLSDELLGSILSHVHDDLAERAGAERAVLCLNYDNMLVRRLASISDRALIRRGVEVLYVQALLLGRQPMQPAERDLLSTSLIGLLDQAIGALKPGGDGT